MHETSSESGFVGFVLRVVVWVSSLASFCSIPSGGGMHGAILLRNMTSVEPSGRHSLRSVVNILGSHDISTLLSQSLLKQRVSSQVRNVA